VTRAMMILALASLLTACSFSLRSSAPPVETYVLRIPDYAQQPALAAPGGPSLRVLSPTAAPGLGSERIMLLQSDRRLSYYAASRWVAALPSMIEQLAVDTLRRSHTWSAVEDSSGVLPATYFLQLDIRRFEADYTEGSGPPVVQVAFQCTLGHRGAEQELVTSFLVTRTVRADQNRLGVVVAAFEQAAGAALSEVAERAHAAIERSGGSAATSEH
jgi:cholesterol transport system auxiliary component